jgi:hypothetical protein
MYDGQTVKTRPVISINDVRRAMEAAKEDKEDSVNQVNQEAHAVLATW